MTNGPYTNDHIRQTFRRAFNGEPNLMTPEILRYGKKGDLIYELSRGSGIKPGTLMFGVSVLTKDGKRTDLSEGGFSTLEEAEDYIATLKDPQRSMV